MRDLIPEAEQVAREYLAAADGDALTALAMAAVEIAHLAGAVSAGFVRAKVVDQDHPAGSNR